MSEMMPKVVVSALVVKDNKILLTKELLESNRECWIIPGGKVDFGESLQDAVKREIKEETNLEIEVLKLMGFRESINTRYNYHTVIFFFLAKQLNEDIVLEEKVLQAGYFSVDEAMGLELVDSAKWALEKYFNGISSK